MNQSIPPETIIKLSKWKIVWLIAMFVVAIGGIASLIQGGSIPKYIMAIVSIIIGSGLVYAEYRNLLELNKPQLIISTKGIQTSDDEFHPWQTISNEKLIPLGSIKPTWFLWFESPGGNRKIHLDGLNKSPNEIIELVKLYKALAYSLPGQETDDQ
ncbi:hypothetical protein [Mucilaginibacter antarcticus]|uniref:PH (Pleckstrin Homology) domain-containing protein n=1 Tax=Mucilaginibacter antarcticus TaxID=1855725 RepID=A0ABW5XQK6_9SPHI